MALLSHLYFLVGSGSEGRYDSNAFLFSLVNKPGWAPVKLPQTGKYSYRRQYSILTITHHMGLHSEEDMTFTYQTTRHPIAIHIATLTVSTAHRAGTVTAAPSPKHSWQDHTISYQTK